jgi:DNA polymerase (family 10)
MDNQKIADIFQEIANMMDIRGDNRFRVIAYSRAAQTISGLAFDLRDVVMRDVHELNKIPGIGQALAATIVELVTTNRCEWYEELKAEFPPGVLQMLKLRGVGPKKVKLFYGTLGIKTIAELKKAAQAGKIRELPKMGEKSESEVLASIEHFESTPHDRRSLHEGFQEAMQYIVHMKKSAKVKKIEYAGSLRRGSETIGDVDLLVAAKDSDVPAIMKHFLEYGEVAKVLGHGETKSSVVLKSSLQVDLRVIPLAIFGAALHYFTGSKNHNIRIRDRAKKMGLKVNEYGVFRLPVKEGGEEVFVAGATEEELFSTIHLAWIPPEMREDRGEVELSEKLFAKKKKMPELVELSDLRGDMHCHSEWSDGTEPLEVVAQGYMKAGFEYMAMTDHSKAVGITQGLTDEKAQRYFAEIERVQKVLGNTFTILKGSEVDILKDGSLDYSDKVLKQFDWLVGSVHSHFKLPQEDQTKRVLTAIQSGYLKVLGHPTSRLIHDRPPILLNMEAIIKACIDHHVALEINGSPSRMDLNDVHVKMAHDMGAKFVISTDSHHSSHMGFLHYGILTARRGWLTKEAVLNTWPLEKLLRWFQK